MRARAGFGILAVLVMLVGSASAARASSIAMFAAPGFVDVTNEQPKMLANLVALGHTVTTFVGTNGAAFSAALAGMDVLVIPEQEAAALFPAMDAAAIAAVQAFVSAGGGFIVAGDAAGNAPALLNGLFGYSVTHNSFVAGGTTSLDAAAAAGTSFAGGPAVLNNVNGTELLNTASLPGGALSIYHDATRTSVFASTYGSGAVVFLGYDWFTTPTPADWSSVLGAAVTHADAGAAVPEPASLLLLATGLGIGARKLSRRRRSL